LLCEREEREMRVRERGERERERGEREREREEREGGREGERGERGRERETHHRKGEGRGNRRWKEGEVEIEAGEDNEGRGDSLLRNVCNNICNLFYWHVFHASVVKLVALVPLSSTCTRKVVAVAEVSFVTYMQLALTLLPCTAPTSCSAVFNLYEERPKICVCYDYTGKVQKIRVFGTKK